MIFGARYGWVGDVYKQYNVDLINFFPSVQIQMIVRVSPSESVKFHRKRKKKQ